MALSSFTLFSSASIDFERRLLISTVTLEAREAVDAEAILDLETRSSTSKAAKTAYT